MDVTRLLVGFGAALLGIWLAEVIQDWFYGYDGRAASAPPPREASALDGVAPAGVHTKCWNASPSRACADCRAVILSLLCGAR
jgi:hypothetical protein